jgi:hypothetical protein
MSKALKVKMLIISAADILQGKKAGLDESIEIIISQQLETTQEKKNEYLLFNLFLIVSFLWNIDPIFLTGSINLCSKSQI